jgi:hypothetical protein
MKAKLLLEVVVDIQEGLSKPDSIKIITQDLHDRLHTNGYDPLNTIQYDDCFIRLYVPNSSYIKHNEDNS